MTRMAASIYFATMLLPVVAIAAPKDGVCGIGTLIDVQAHVEVIQAGTQKLDPSKSPKTIDVMMTEGLKKGAVMLGIYEIDGDTLRVCFDEEGKKRPTEFKSPAGSQTFVNVHKRAKK